MLERTFGSIKVPSNVARRDGLVEYLRSEANRLKAALTMREKEIVRLRAQLEAINKEKTHVAAETE